MNLDDWLGWLQCVVNGLSAGGFYALLALGYALVFGVLRFVNFAHGDLMMVGTYGVLGLGNLGCSLGLSLLGGMLLSGGSAMLIYKALYRPWSAPLKMPTSSQRFKLLLMAIAVGLLLENLLQALCGSQVRTFPFSGTDALIILFDQRLLVRVFDLEVAAVSLTMALGLNQFIRRSRFGLALRALASEPRAAILVGIPYDRIVPGTFFLGAVLATLGGALQAMITRSVYPTMGIAAGLKAFAAAVLGGIGSLWGAVVGGFILGTAESVFIKVGLSSWKDALGFALLILVLSIRPQGLFGTLHRVKI